MVRLCLKKFKHKMYFYATKAGKFWINEPVKIKFETKIIRYSKQHSLLEYGGI